MLENKKIVLGITGGIAAYKAAELTRAFIKAGAQVRVIMTKSAMEFITPLTMQTLSQGPVYTDMFAPTDQYDMAHIALADFADAFVIAPATGNVIAVDANHDVRATGQRTPGLVPVFREERQGAVQAVRCIDLLISDDRRHDGTLPRHAAPLP